MVTFTDPLLSRQWHLTLHGNLSAVWDDYSGKDIRIGVYDDGIQYNHPDLDANYDDGGHFTYDGTTYNPYPIALQPGWDADGHGTSVAGIIAAEAGNGRGGVGVAWGASVTGVNILSDERFFEGSEESDALVLASYRHAATFDIMSNSWGYDARQFDASLNRADPTSFGSATVEAFGFAAETGRGGLGTVIVKSAGNDAANSNGEGINGARFVIDVAALTPAGQVQSYSNYGTTILVSAGAAEVTTDLLGRNGYATASGAAGDYTADFGGTSGAAAVVSGVAALMMDANPNLGWRDVREILATSASLTGSVVTGNQNYEVSGTYFQRTPWASFATETWNEGGRAYSLDYGFGKVNAFAAVRMAEVWSLFQAPQTSANEKAVSVSIAETEVVRLNSASWGSDSVVLNVTEGLRVENVDLTITLNMQPYSSSRVLHLGVMAPDGTSFPVLIDLDEFSPSPDGEAYSWTFGISQALGLNGTGEWKIKFEMPTITAGDIKLNVTELKLDLFGSDLDEDTVHHLTRDFLAVQAADAGSNRDRVIEDTNGGIDWINMSSIAGSVWASLGGVGSILVNGTKWVTLWTADAIENIVTGDGADTLTGSLLGNRLHGMRGNDTINGQAGNDTLDGGSGDDRLSGGSEDDTLSGKGGTDRLEGGLGQDSLMGGEGSDSLTGGDGDDSLAGETGNDTLTGGTGNDLLEGGTGLDTLIGEEGDDTLFGGSGVDMIRGGVGRDEMTGGDGNDLFLIGDFSHHAAGEVMTGDAGTDTLRYVGTVAGTLVLDASVDVERVVIGTGSLATAVLTGATAINVDASALAQAVAMIGNAGANQLTGSALADSLDGWAGNDSLVGASGNDTLAGSEGNDLLAGGLGDDLLKGGAGSDRAVFTGPGDVTVNLSFVTAQATGEGSDTLTDIEHVTSGEGNDRLTGNGLANALNGGQGDDTLLGSGGNDTLNGADGEDELRGGLGDDQLNGGEGRDTAVFAGAAAVVNLSILTAQATGLGLDRLSGIENLRGGTLADRLTGDAFDNRIEGDAGNDTLAGAAGNDTLAGGLGGDRIGGGLGDDILEGGGGADQFVFNSGGGQDRIEDFEDGLDRILIGTGAEGFLDLAISAVGLDTVVSFAEVVITLAGIDLTLIAENDFVFV